MKKTLLLTLFVAMAVSVFAQLTPRTVLLEHFTSASCGPCATSNPLVKQYFDNTSTNVVAIKYQGNFGYDPMEDHNPAEVNDRAVYYGVTGVPTSVIDGGTFSAAAQDHPGTLFSGGASSVMDNRAAVASDFDIFVSHSLNSNLTSLDITAVVTAQNAVANANLVAHVVVVEKQISYASAPGTNGETEFYNVMKKMLPTDAGTDLQDVWTVGNSIGINESWNLANVYSIGELAVVVFIQDIVTKEVYQAAYSETITLPANLQTADVATAATHTNSGLCNTTYTPSVTVSNNSSDNLNSVEVSYTINNAPGGSQVVAIASNGNQTVNFPDITVAFGDEVVFSSVIQDNGYLDLSTTNNTTVVNNFVVLDAAFDNGTGIDVTFDNLPAFAPSPPGAIDENLDGIDAFYIDSDMVNGIDGGLGGHGNSDGCFFWDFFTIQSGSSSLVFEEIDLTGTYNNMLSLAYSHAQYSANTNDALVISASEDCGVTWVELFNKSGSDISTAAISTNRFFPAAAEWDDATIDMSMFDGKSDIVLKIEGVSDYGNSLYVDDIKTSNFLVSTEDEKLESSLNVYPNPTVNDFTINFEINEATDLNITLVNAVGQTIRTISNEKFVAGEHNIAVDVANLATGTYFVNIRNEAGVTTKTLTITK